jgi:putative ABC transport system permease protein
MVISVLERRSEIGLRRALGATKGHIRIQFLSEAVPLALLGGAVGVGLGVLSTAIYATTKGWTVVVPVLAWGGGFGAALLIGAVAGLLPAPTRHLISLLAGRWTLAVLAQLADGGRRYQDLDDALEGVSHKCSPKTSGEPNATD